MEKNGRRTSFYIDHCVYATRTDKEKRRT